MRFENSDNGKIFVNGSPKYIYAERKKHIIAEINITAQVKFILRYIIKYNNELNSHT